MQGLGTRGGREGIKNTVVRGLVLVVAAKTKIYDGSRTTTKGAIAGEQTQTSPIRSIDLAGKRSVRQVQATQRAVGCASEWTLAVTVSK